MRQLKYLIKEAKENTNTVDAEAISNSLCTALFNRCQNYVMATLFNANIETNIFRATQNLTVQTGIDTYDLPFDIYAVNSISSVQQVIGAIPNITYVPLKQISQKARGIKTGYFTSVNQIIFSPPTFSTQNILISYTKKLPTMGLSYGSILSVAPTSIVLNPGYTSLTDVDDFFSVVDSNGVILAKNLPVNQAGNTLTVPSSTGAVVGAFVVPGTYASTHCFLPEEMESTLIYMLEKLIDARQSSIDVKLADIMSKEQLVELAEMFADNSSDSFTPPIIEYTEWA